MNLLFIFCMLSPLVSGQVQVKIDSGILSSDIILKSRNSTPYHAFLGVPYAAPPVGELRFMPPQNVKPWDDVRNASQFSSICAQHVFTGEELLVTASIKGSEDCLYLNVYTPKVTTESNLPVLVYIHGGYFIKGSGNMLNPGNYMDYPMVVVIPNYRLGVFGYMSTGDEIIPGNYALKDQVAVLRWVQRNIAAFGGDPKSVTIMGLSAGANNVHFHMMSPLSAGLFHKVIILSGSAVSLRSYLPAKYAQSIFKTYAKEANCDQVNATDAMICLKNMNTSQLLATEYSLLKNIGAKSILAPVIEPTDVEDAFITTSPHNLQYPNPKLPILSGLCSAEGKFPMTFYLKGNFSSNTSNFYSIIEEQIPSLLSYKYFITGTDQMNNITHTLMNYYFNGSKQITLDDATGFFKMVGEFHYQLPIVNWISAYAGKIYQYLFDYETEDLKEYVKEYPYLDQIPGASHADDFLLTASLYLNGTDIKVSKQLVYYYANFIITGNPNSETNEDNFTIWKPIQSKKIEYLIIDEDGQASMKSGLFNNDIDFYNSLPFKYYV